MASTLDSDASPATAGATGGEASRALELELRHVQKRYPGRRDAAIPDLSLTVPAGEVCVLVGPSGSGKTTAMRLINRMIPLSGGDILLGGRSVLERDPTELRREIGYVIQQIGLFPHQTVQREHRHRSEAARLAQGPHRVARARVARADLTRPSRGRRAATRTSSPAVSASASASPARSPPIRRCC